MAELTTPTLERSSAWRVLVWCVPVALSLVYVVWARETDRTVAVPFLLLFVAVVLASFGGKAPGTLAGVLAAGFVLNSTAIGFGPATLTGDYVRAALGCAIYVVTGWALGRTRDENRRLLAEVTDARHGLEATVATRTAELERSNEALRAQMLERSQMRAALDEAESIVRHHQRLESIGVLAGGIAHDFNNLLTVIRGNVSVLRETATDAGVAGLLDHVEAASARAAELCEQMLSYAGESRTEKTTFSLGELIEEMIQFARSSVPSLVRFELHGADDVTLHADQGLVGQAVFNLLINAAEAIDDAGTVRTSVVIRDLAEGDTSEFLLGQTIAAGTYVEIEVNDDGAGIDAEHVERIFDPFYSTKVAGRGLGLAVVFGAARAHGGAVRVSSTLGRGTSMSFVLPLRAGEAAPGAGRPDVHMAATTDRARGRILVADDDDAVRRLIVTVLVGAGWKVVQATNGREAVERVRDHPDLALALIDLTMPEMDGNQAAEQIATLDDGLPVVIMSGYSRESNRLSGIAYLGKPFDAAQLRRTVNEAARPVSG